jgi:hypothetical protein
VPFGVDGTAHDPPRQAAHVLLPAREQAEQRPAEPGEAAQPLPFADDDVRAARARRREQAERDRVHVHHQQRAARVGGLRDRPEILDHAEEVGLLDDDARRCRR